MTEDQMRQQDRQAQNAIAKAYGFPIPYGIESLAVEGESKTDRELRELKAKAEAEASRIEALCEELASLQGLDWRAQGMKIARAVAKAHGLSWTEFTSRRRWKHLTKARQHAMWEIYRLTQLSLPEIARLLGGFDHTTILYGIRKHQKRIENGEFPSLTPGGTGA